MGKLIGIALMVVGLWVGLEVFQNGTEGAFGGILGGGRTDEETRTSAPQRAGRAVQNAHSEADERRQRMLGD